MVRLANEIHGFAGYYIDHASGQLVAYVKDTSPAFAAAARALNAHLSTDGFGLPTRVRPKNVRIVKADYDFQTLSDYRDIISDSIMMVVPGVASVDLDEAINRVTVGILASAADPARVAVLARAKQFGIPATAINFVMDTYARTTVGHFPIARAMKGAARMTTAARTRWLSANNLEALDYDTVAAGEIFYDPAGTGSVCTVGAVVDSSSQRLFVSDSHCTQTLFQNDGDVVKSLGATPIAYEQNDPPSSQTCTSIPVTCWYHRSSDAASFKLYAIPAANTRVGIIVRPSTRNYVGLGGSRDTSISSTHPWLYITGTLSASSLISGTQVDKIGAYGGWVYGSISSTCVDIYITTNTQVYCTALSHDLGNRTGDSGGPIFVWDGMDGAALAGTTEAGWGSSAGYWGGTEYVGTYFNYWQSVVFDLGNLNAANNTTVGSPDDVSGSVSGGNGLASWSAVATTNTTAATSYEIFETIWDASTQSYTESDQYVGSTTQIYTPVWAPWSLYGIGYVDGCTSWVSIQIVAYNSGVFSPGSTANFIGPANGPPDCLASRVVPKRPGATGGRPY